MSTLRGHYAELLTSVSHLALLGVAFYFAHESIWIVCLGAVCLISFFAWASNYKRVRFISDTPTSRISSAAQGYAELYGRVTQTRDNLISSPLSNTICVWFRYWIYTKHEDSHGWQEESYGVSDSLFEINDGTGTCLIDPDDAEVIAPVRRITKHGQYKYVEDLLLADHVYALGEFSSLGGANAQLNLKQDVTALLMEWKQTPKLLHERFDLDGNGQIDMQEWGLARRAAHREVEQQHRELRTASGIHVMRAPRNGRPYLLSSHTPHKLRSTYMAWGFIHLSIAFAAFATTMWLWQGHRLQELFA